MKTLSTSCNNFFFAAVRAGIRVLFFGVLHLLTILWIDVWMQLVLGEARHSMVESGECLFDVDYQGEVDLGAIVIPVEVNTEVALSCPIMGDVVMLLKDVHEVLRMLFAYIFDSKVVNAEREVDWVSGVCTETGVK